MEPLKNLTPKSGKIRSASLANTGDTTPKTAKANTDHNPFDAPRNHIPELLLSWLAK
jgi:hypothetical protein